MFGNGAAATINGVGTNASFFWPEGLAMSRNGTFALISEHLGNRIRYVDLATAQVNTLAGSGIGGSADGSGTSASFNHPACLAISADDSFALLADGHGPLSPPFNGQTGNNLIRRIDISTGAVSTLAGRSITGAQDGIGTLATFNHARGIALSPDGSYALITDWLNYRIRRLNMTSMAVTTVAGSTQGFADGTGTNAKFEQMLGIAIDSAGLYALICDYNNHRIRRLDCGLPGWIWH
jgi:sugar lactone lactonase YvrE